jgi:hypothetical protein
VSGVFNIREYASGPITTRTVIDPWISSDACDCSWGPCADRFECQNPVRGRTKEMELCWEVSGSVTLEAKVGLKLRLIGELTGSVETGLSLSGCVTMSQSMEFFVPQSQCFRTHAREVWQEATNPGTVREVQARYAWKRYISNPDGSVTEIDCGTTECGVKDGSGSAQLDAGSLIQYAPRTEACGGAALPSPDPYDGKRAEPCCPTAAGCAAPPPGQNPCCGCYASP